MVAVVHLSDIAASRIANRATTEVRSCGGRVGNLACSKEIDEQTSDRGVLLASRLQERDVCGPTRRTARGTVILDLALTICCTQS